MVMDTAKEHANNQLTNASKRIKTLVTEAQMRETKLTEACSEVISLEKQLCEWNRSWNVSLDDIC